ncbi:MAG TPA: rhodanese-like domain-containing protein [Syntrophales bacterium]|nr:rhodanese-like domain-containing protein [Syntrophales bacterium]
MKMQSYRRLWVGIFVFFLSVQSPSPASPQKPGDGISPEELYALMKKKEVSVICTESYLECMDGRIPDSLCISCEEFGKKATTLLKDKNKPIVLYCGSETCNEGCSAVDQVKNAGYKKIYILSGGLYAWKAAGYRIETPDRVPRVHVPSVKPVMLEKWLNEKKEILILDVRPEAVFEKAHIEGAVNIPLYQLHRRYYELPYNRKVVVVDENGEHSYLASSYIARKGVDDVTRLSGGMAGWNAFAAKGKKKLKK